MRAALAYAQAVEQQLRARFAHLRESYTMVERARDRLADLYDFAPIGVLTLDAAGVVREINLFGAALLGRERRHIIGTPFAAYVDDRAAIRRHMAACRGGTAAATTEVWIKPRDSSTRRMALLSQRSNAAAGFHTALIDLSEREAVEEEHERLRSAERAAKEANEAKDTFIAVLSHELRAPLTPALAAASAIEEGGLPLREVERLSRVIARNVKVQARLVDDLLDATRIARRKLSLAVEPTDVHTLVREVVEALAEEARQKRLRLTVDLAAASCWVQGDATRLRQVFWNLCKNAVKFTQRGGTIAMQSWNNGAVLVIEVSDSGMGFEPGAALHLFAPFEQRTSTEEGGLGLGLAIAKGIVDLHDGRISAFSAGVGRGARFAVELATTAAPAQPAAVARSGRPGRPLRGPRHRILLVDDHRDTVEALSLALAKQGYDVRTASSVGRALKVDMTGVDLLISDIGLPGGGGLRLIRKMHQRVPVKAIALSGYGTEQDVRASLEAGFLAHLTKPVSIRDLVAAVDAALAGHPAL